MGLFLMLIGLLIMFAGAGAADVNLSMGLAAITVKLLIGFIMFLAGLAIIIYRGE